MKVWVKVLIGFNEPNGTRHEAGEEVELDTDAVPDLEYLAVGGTLQPLKVSKPENTKPYKPAMETKDKDSE